MAGNGSLLVAMLNRCCLRERFAFRTALLSFSLGSLATAYLMHSTEVRAESNHVFELMVYHARPGKGPELESIFREVSKLQTKHNLSAVGYWVPDGNPAWSDTFVYVVTHQSLEEAKKNWDALHTDPAFLPFRKAAAPLIEQVNGMYRVDEVFMRPSEYSAMK